MAALTFFNAFKEDLSEKAHNLQADAIKIMLTNTAPVATNSVKADLVEIASVANGYTAGGTTAAITSSVQTSGVYKLILADVTFTQAGANAVGPFRYAVLYNDTQTAPVKPLIGFYDYGSALTLAALSGESFLVDLDGTNGVLTLS
ncbi:MAG: hypothetical protein H0U87_09520 [Acidobacteria bacterium]|jgi:hypothetical protein|nr:hypothetical protein [Acidobacteriota bacterium]